MPWISTARSAMIIRAALAQHCKASGDGMYTRVHDQSLLVLQIHTRFHVDAKLASLLYDSQGQSVGLSNIS